MNHAMIFDIETIPDVASGRKLYNLEGSDAEVAAQMFAKRKEETGSEFLRLHLQKIAVISIVWATPSQIKVTSLGDANSTEAELIEKFFELIQERTPTLVSWNGSGFDLPVLHYRALMNHIVAKRYWMLEDPNDPNFKWNNYLNRYHYRHLDLMDVLACYQSKANAPLDDIATMLGFPGKMGMSGDKVWEGFLQGELHAIRNYCETDVLNTYLVFLQFEYMRGKITLEELLRRKQILRDYLLEQKQAHFDEFLQRWVEKT